MNSDKELLSIRELQDAMLKRMPFFMNSRGQRAHSQDDGSDWSPAEWLQATIGELGEYANIRKKFERGDLRYEDYKREAAKELADVLCYLAQLANRALDYRASELNGLQARTDPTGIDLGEATRAKFNEVSDRFNCSVKL